MVRQVCGHIRESIRYGLEHRDEAVTYAAQFARGLSPDRVDRFIEMYANERSLDYGPAGRAAIGRLFEEAHAAGLVPERLAVRFAGDNG